MALRFSRSWCNSDNRIDGKTVIITGGNTGIGKATAIDLAKKGGRIVICCRNQQRAENAVEEIKSKSGSQNVLYYLMDLASLQSVRDCCKQVLNNETQIDILINNAGIAFDKVEKTVDGFEACFGVNHLGHFLLTLLLIDKIKQSSQPKIINVSSEAHRSGVIDFDNLREVNPSKSKAYSNSKLANNLFSRELAKRTKNSGIHVYCVHPGLVKTEIFRNIDSRIWSGIISCMLWGFGKTCEEGAQTLIYCAVNEKVANESGLYYMDCKIKEPDRKALDDELAKKLWDVSLQMVALQDPCIE